jgi:hypothetical protein
LAIVAALVSRNLLIVAAVLAAAASPAAAGETACWFDQDVVVVPAEVLGVAGDYVLDTATPHTQLADTQAQGAGFTASALRGEVRLAGLTLRGRPVQVAKLDLRTGAHPTPIAGVIGADLLKAFVVDVSVSPCRVGVWRPGRAPRFSQAKVLPLRWIAGVPTAQAGVSDGPHAWRGDFALATGAATPVRIADALAAAPGVSRPKEVYPYGVVRPRLRALSFAGTLFEDVPAGLLATGDPALAGRIGAPVLAAWRVRFDFPRGRLRLAPAGGRPVSGRRFARSADSSRTAGR